MRSGWILGCLALAALASALERPTADAASRSPVAAPDLRPPPSAASSRAAPAAPPPLVLARAAGGYRAWLGGMRDWGGLPALWPRRADPRAHARHDLAAPLALEPVPPTAEAVPTAEIAPTAEIDLVEPWSPDGPLREPIPSGEPVASGLQARAALPDGRLFADREPPREAARAPHAPRRLGLFMQTAATDASPSAAGRHSSAGITWRGALAGRANDLLGLGARWVGLGDDPGALIGGEAELALRLFYRLQSGSWWSLEPDLCFVVHGAADQTKAGACVASLRFNVRL